MADREIKITVKSEGGGGGIGGAISGLIGKGAGAAGAAAGAAGAAGAAAGAAGLAGTLSVIVGPLLGIVGLLGLLVASSKFAIKTISRLGQLFMRLLRPIGDVIGTLMQPLIILLVPVVRAFSLMMKPFQRLANSLLRSGARLLQTPGFEEEGMAAIMSGVGILMKPFINLFVIAMGEGFILLLNNIAGPLESLTILADFFTGGIHNLQASFVELKEAGFTGIRTAITEWITTSDTEWLASAAAMAISSANLVEAINIVTGGVRELAKEMKPEILEKQIELNKLELDRINAFDLMGENYKTATGVVITNTSLLRDELTKFGDKAVAVMNQLKAARDAAVSDSHRTRAATLLRLTNDSPLGPFEEQDIDATTIYRSAVVDT